MNHIEYDHRALSGVSKIDFQKSMKVCVFIPKIRVLCQNCFCYLDSRVVGGGEGVKSGDKVTSVPPIHAPVLT